MGRYVRYIVHQKIAGRRGPAGLFAAAYLLRDDPDLAGHDARRLDDLLVGFEAELPVPPRHLIPDGAIFWYRQAGRFSDRMWELAALLGEYGYTVELITTAFAGRVVYSDDVQLAAIPPSRSRR